MDAASGDFYCPADRLPVPTGVVLAPNSKLLAFTVNASLFATK
jgi:hypothetical protein